MNPIPVTLIEKLHHPDHNVRSSAVFELNHLDNPNKLSLLIQALRTEPDLNVREDITYALVSLGSEALSSLINLLKNQDAEVRHHAAHTLGKIGKADATEALIDALQDTDPKVSAKAAYALSQIGDAKAIPALIRLLDDDNPDVKTSVMEALETFGALAVPFLVNTMTHEKWQVREQVVEMFGSIQDKEAIPALITALQDEHWQIRFSAVTALGYMRDKTVKDALEQVRDDPVPQINALASKILKQNFSVL